MEISFSFLCLLFLSVTSGLEISYTREEDQGADIYIGNPATDAGLVTLNDTAAIEYSLLTEGNQHANLFSINTRTSSLYTAVNLDHDILCQFVTQCVLTFDIAAKSPINDFFAKITVNVILTDKNDNEPKFPANEIFLEISENSEVGTSFPIDAATDSDSGVNSVQTYAIETDNVPFNIDVNNFNGGQTLLRVVVSDALDRETKGDYTFNVIAIDGGSTPHTGTVTVHVIIEDTNDNPPQFTSLIYNVTVNEDIPISTVILTLNATDPDEDGNGRVLYRLSSHQSESVQRIFQIETNTGELTVIRNFIDEPDQFYRIIVEASDNGTQPLISQAQVFVTIRDTHNKAPEITLNVLSDTYYAQVPESAAIGTVLAIISVKDPDNGDNGRISCSINDQHFQLMQPDQLINEYNVILSQELDREILEWHSVLVFCHDFGIPNLRANVSLSVKVLDINDNPPKFSRSIYYVDVPEIDVSDISILQVKATDSDISIFQNFTYSLGLSAELKDYFTIDKKFGIIRLMKPLDREENPLMSFRVFAADAGNPPMTGTAIVEVNVRDVNDNYPTFATNGFEFLVPENQLPDSYIGRIIATDLDDGENGRVSFELPMVYYDSYLPFGVTENGTLFTERPLDREHVDKYEFTVIASDQGIPSLTSSVNVTVLVQDVNDNAPVITRPNTDDEVLYISYDNLPSVPITKIKAFDLDAGINAKLSFYLLNNNDSRLFVLHEYTGELFINRELSPTDKGAYDLRILVRDNGNPSRSRPRTLSVTISDKVDTNFQTSPEGQIKYYAIAIAISCITIVLSILIILAIVLIRRKDQGKDKYQESVSSNSTMETVAEHSNPDIHLNGTYTREAIQQSMTDTFSRTSNTSSTSEDKQPTGVHSPRTLDTTVSLPTKTPAD